MQKFIRPTILLFLLALSFLTAQGSIIPEAPLLISPSWAKNDTALKGGHDTLRWHKAANALTYRVQVATNGAFSPLFRDSSAVSDTTLAVTLALSTQKYYWRVKSFNGESESGWSAIDSFATYWHWGIMFPWPRVPQSNAIAMPSTPTLMCSKVDDATGYHFQVGKSLASFFNDSGFTFNDSTIADTVVTIGPLTSGTKYYWRVRAFTVDQESPFSPTDSFTVMFTPTAPALAYPIHNSANVRADTLILRWHSVEGDSNYVCQWWTYTFNGIILRSDTTKRDTALKVTGLMNRSKYYWKVMAFNQGGTSEFSSVDSFTTVIEAPLAPRPIHDHLDFLFMWHPVAIATKYHLQIATNNSSYVKSIVIDTIVVDTIVTVPFPFMPNTTYFWRVSGINIGGEGPYSAVMFFTTYPDGVAESGNGIPAEFALLQNYPNPFNPSTTIRFDLPNDAYVKVTVFDLLGREVTILADGEHYAGRYRIDWSPSSLSSGVYFYRIAARSLNGSGEFSAVKKLLFVK